MLMDVTSAEVLPFFVSFSVFSFCSWRESQLARVFPLSYSTSVSVSCHQSQAEGPASFASFFCLLQSNNSNLVKFNIILITIVQGIISMYIIIVTINKEA